MTDRQRTHSHDCWSWGPAHYECAVSKIKTLASGLRQAKAKLDAAQAEARELRALVTEFANLTRDSGWLYVADELERRLAAIASQPAGQHDPLVVSDHCDSCGESGPECAYVEPESLPLMARREWMGDSTDYFVVHGDFCLEVESFRGKAPHYEADGSLIVIGDSAVRDQVDAEAQPDGIYRIADTDEHGLPVIERTADMPEDATHMTLRTRRFFRAGELRARSVEGDEGLLRIEDYRSAAQES